MLYHLLATRTRAEKGAVLLAFDIFMLAIITALVWFGTSEETFRGLPLGSLSFMFLTMACVLVCLQLWFGIHRVPLNGFGHRAILQTGVVATCIFAAGVLSLQMVTAEWIASSIGGISGGFLIVSVLGRIVLREFVTTIYRRQTKAVRVMIYGAGRTGQQLAAALAVDQNVQAIGFVDDNPVLSGVTIAGLRVNTSQKLPDLISDQRIDRVVLAMPGLSARRKDELVRRLAELPCEIHAIPTFERLIRAEKHAAQTEPLDFSNLLFRDQVDAKLPGLSAFYQGKTVLVTGAGGSIGSELCRQVAQCRPERIILLDHSEFALYRVNRQMNEAFPDAQLETVLGSVCNPDFVDHLFSTFRIDITLHAAAYKQLPMLEENALEGVRNNVIGTRVVAVAAIKHGCESFILISTDKAVRPTSWLGYSKRLAEIFVQDLASRSTTTRLSMVRFGNVLGSAGSVVPLFQEQIDRGGPVTVTDPNATRYFMSLSEAVRLVMLAATYARGGEVFVLNMGEPVRILDVARKLIEARGFSVKEKGSPHGQIEIKLTGLRPGEKVSEELLIGQNMLPTPHPKILRALEVKPSELETAKILKEIALSLENYDARILNNIPKTWAFFFGQHSEIETGVQSALREVKA